MTEETRKIIDRQVRKVELRLVGYTRALELCSRMNYETENLDFIDTIPAGAVLYDLGACEGRFSVYAALHGIRTYALEPEARNYEALRENIALNQERFPGEGAVIALKLAVGKEDHDTTIRIAQPWAGGHQRVVTTAPSRTDLDFAFSSEQPIRVVSLDRLISAEGLPEPHYLKIDVDGSEVPFLEGAQNTLHSQRLKGIIFELNMKDDSYAWILETLNSAGFHKERECQVETGSLYNTFFTRRAN